MVDAGEEAEQRQNVSEFSVCPQNNECRNCVSGEEQEQSERRTEHRDRVNNGAQGEDKPVPYMVISCLSPLKLLTLISHSVNLIHFTCSPLSLADLSAPYFLWPKIHPQDPNNHNLHNNHSICSALFFGFSTYFIYWCVLATEMEDQ